MPESAAETRASRRKLAIPVVVLTAGRDEDPVWRALQRDQVGLSQEGCQVVAEHSGHGIALGQPEAVVDAIRAIVDRARGGNDVALCGSREVDEPR